MPDFKPDTSIYGGFRPPAAMSPQEGINTALGALQLQGKSKIGDIYQSAIDPTTGEYDPAKVIKRAPEAGVLAPEMITTALQNAHQGIVLDYDKLTATRTAWENMGQLLAAHVDDRDFGVSKMQDILMQFVGNPRFGGLIGNAAVTQMLKNLYNPATGKPDDEKARKLARNLISTTMSAHDQTQMFDYYQKPDGTYVKITKNRMLVDQISALNKAAAGGGAAPPPGGGGAPGPGTPGGGPSAELGASGRPLTGAITSGVPAGETALQESRSASGQALEQAALASNDRTAALENLQQDFGILKDKMSSKTATEAEINTFIRRIAGFGITMSKEQVAAAESAEKLTNQIISAQGQSMHLTDQAQRTNLGATPRINMSHGGADLLTKMALGNEHAIRIKADEWGRAQDAGNLKGSDFYKWSRSFNKGFNPRIFQFSYMNADQRKVVLNSMDSDKEKEKFLGQVAEYEKKGWIEPPPLSVRGITVTPPAAGKK